jgi:uncharacterized repeat protein (TIGR01451 family)
MKNFNLKKSFLTLLIPVFLVVVIQSKAQVSLLVTTETTSDGNLRLDSIKTGKPFIFVIDYSVSSLTQNGNNVVIKVQLPTNLTVAGGSTSYAYDHSQITSVTNVGGVITATCINPIPAGSTGQMQISMLYTNGSTPNGYRPNIITTITATNASNSPLSDTTDIKALATNSITLNKTKYNYSTSPTLNGPYTYTIAYNNSGGSEGNLNLYNAAIVDTLPPGVEFVSATKFGSIAAVATPLSGAFAGYTEVKWDWGATTFSGSGSANLTVKYTSPTFSVGSTFSNCASLTGNIPVLPFVGNAATLAPAPPLLSCINGSLASSSSNINNGGSGIGSNIPGLCPGTVMAGSSATFTSGWTNKGNTDLDSVEVIQTIDPNIDVTAVYAQKVQNGVPGSVTPQVLVYEYYQLNTNPGVWVAVSGSPFNNTSLAASNAVSLSAGQYIIKTKIVIKPGVDAIGPYFSQNLNYVGSIRTAVQGPNGGGTIIQGSNNPGTCAVTIAGTTVKNCYTLTAGANGAAALVSNPSCGNTNIVGQAPVFSSLNKATINGSSFAPADTVTYEISAKQLGIGTAQNVIWRDTLDARLTYISGSAQFKLNSGGTYAPIAAGNVTVDGQKLAFALNPVDSGSQIFVKFSAKIADGTPPATIPNRATLYSSNSYINAGNPNTNTPSITVITAAAYTSKLGQTGCDTTHFVYYPEDAHATPQGKIKYRALLKNTGNIGGNNITLIDVFPFIADNRGSTYFANLIAPITFSDPSSIVYYDTVSNPCMPEFNPAINPAGCRTANWSITPPADITSVKAIKVTRSATLAPLDSLIYSWPMVLPVGVPANIVMYNSYTYQLKRADNSAQLLPAVPNKVGMITDCISPLGALGNYAWVDSNANGLQDEAVAAGINGLKIYLYKPGPSGIVGNSDQVLLDSTFTGNDFYGKPGYYTFTNLNTGDYYVQFPSINNKVFTKKDQTIKTDGNSDADRTTGYSGLVHIDAAGTGLDKDNPTIDAGYIPCTLNVVKVKTDITCHDYNDGKITLTVTGNRGSSTYPYLSFLWNDGVITKDRQYLASGTYSVLVTDSVGCKKTLTDSIINPKVLAPIQMNKPYICIDSSVTLTDSTAGGKWYINDTNLAKIDSVTGVIKGKSVGTAIVSYKINNYSCGITYFYPNIVTCDSTGTVNGGGSGGLESKSLGDAVAQRMYTKAKHNELGTVDYSKLKAVTINQPTTVFGGGANGFLALSAVLPTSLNSSNNYKSYISTPTDIPSITNAIDVLSIDYTLNNEAKAVSFATQTKGAVYDHTKAICDRLKGSVLQSMNTIVVNNMPMVTYVLKTPQGYTEYAMSFIVGAKTGRNSYTLQSNWLNQDYTTDEVMYNIQLWAVSMDMVIDMANQVIAKFQADKAVQTITGAALPKTYITAGNRDKTNLVLNVTNNQSATSGYFTILDKSNENSTALNNRTVTFSVPANGKTAVTIPMSDMYESTISLYINNQLQDVVFMADGAWTYATGNNSSVYSFKVNNDPSRTFTSEEYPIFRNVQIAGSLGDYISIFKLLKGGATTQDLSAYKTLKFTASGGGNLRITMVKNSVANWTDQYTTVLPLDKNTKDYNVALSSLASAATKDKINANDVTMVLFALESSTGQAAAINNTLSNVSFIKQDVAYLASLTAKDVTVFPNPINGTTFTCSFMSDKIVALNMRVIDIATGRTAITKAVNAIAGENKVSIDLGTKNPASVYVVTLEGDDVKYNNAKIVISKK